MAGADRPLSFAALEIRSNAILILTLPSPKNRYLRFGSQRINCMDSCISRSCARAKTSTGPVEQLNKPQPAVDIRSTAPSQGDCAMPLYSALLHKSWSNMCRKAATCSLWPAPCEPASRPPPAPRQSENPMALAILDRPYKPLYKSPDAERRWWHWRTKLLVSRRQKHVHPRRASQLPPRARHRR